MIPSCPHKISQHRTPPSRDFILHIIDHNLLPGKPETTGLSPAGPWTTSAPSLKAEDGQKLCGALHSPGFKARHRVHAVPPSYSQHCRQGSLPSKGRELVTAKGSGLGRRSSMISYPVPSPVFLKILLTAPLGWLCLTHTPKPQITGVSLPLGVSNAPPSPGPASVYILLYIRATTATCSTAESTET